ncbi:calcium-binding protein [Actinoplanes sp. NPDC049596]|uniref:calcium-binding protein n=1 Tax=unclassified Actinoplanes TaxID=2626549 RepID=UPI00343638D7
MKLTRKSKRIVATVFGGAAVAAAGVVALPADAAATGTVSVIDRSIVALVDSSSRAHNAVITRSGRTITVDDVVGITAGAGCAKVDGTKVRCALKADPTRLRVYLGPKNDTVVNRTDVAITARGGAGADRLTGGSRPDLLVGEDGNDAVWGQGGNDQLEGNDGNDALSGGDGNDSVFSHEGADTLYGGAGFDVLDDGTGNDRVYAGDGNDLVTADLGNDIIDGGNGDDELTQEWAPSGADADSWIGGAGMDAVSYESSTKPIVADADAVKGDDGQAGERDTIGASVEYIKGGSGNDRLLGTARNEWLYGGPGNDVIAGGGGNDVLLGGAGRDYLNGAAGNDALFGDDPDHNTPVADTLIGGPGRDYVSYAAYKKPVTVDLDGSAGDDGQAGEKDTVAADVEDVFGGDGNDRITGNAAANDIDAGRGNNTVRGGAGNDVIRGYLGVDTFYGEAGDDKLYAADAKKDDHIDGGAGVNDYCSVDTGDAMTNCEKVEYY